MECKILINGVSGFVGSHLYKSLKKNPKNRIYFTCRESNEEENSFACNFNFSTDLIKILSKLKPDFIYHLHGSFTNNYREDYNANVNSTKIVLEALTKSCSATRLILVGSAAEYGTVDKKYNPISERHALNPTSIYGLTKVMQTHLAQYYFRNKDIDVVIVRTFNLIGKGQSENLFLGSLYKQISLIKEGKIEKIKLGDLSGYRDYISIDKACKLYEIIANVGVSGEVYNVGTGKPISIRKLLKEILDEENVDESLVEENKFKKSYREADISYADISKLKAILKNEI